MRRKDRVYACPNCGSSHASPSEQWRLLDGVLLLLGVIPHTCEICAFQFRRPREVEARWSRDGFSLKLLPSPGNGVGNRQLRDAPHSRFLLR